MATENFRPEELDITWTYATATKEKVPIRPSKKFPKECYYAQLYRASLQIPDKIDVEMDKLKLTKKRMLRAFQNIKPPQYGMGARSWYNREIFEVGEGFIGMWVSRVLDDDKIIEGRILKLTDEYAVVEVHEGGTVAQVKDPPKKKWPLDRQVIHGSVSVIRMTPEEREEYELRLLRTTYGYLPETSRAVVETNEKGECVAKAKRERVGNDKYGYRLGTRAAKINAVLTFTYQTLKQIQKAAPDATSISGHLDHLVKKKIAKVKIFDGVKKWRLRKDHPSVKGQS